MTERQALAGAGAAHLILFAMLSLGWSMLKQPPQIEEAVPVDLVDVAPQTQVTERPKPSKAAAPQETAAPAPSPEPAKAEPPTPVPEAVPLPEPKPVEKPAPPKPETPPKPVEKPKPAKPKPAKAETKPVERLDTSELSSLIDKALPKAERKVRDPDAFAKSITMSIPKSAKLDARATASLVAAIRAQIVPCWNPPIGGAEIKRMTALLSIQLSPDGTVAGRPTVISQTGGGGALGKAFADTAVRAVLRCAPLKLPADQYEAWKSFELNFDPKDL